MDGAGKPLHIDVGQVKAAQVAAGRHDGRRLRVAPEDVLLQVVKSVGLVHAHLEGAHLLRNAAVVHLVVQVLLHTNRVVGRLEQTVLRIRDVYPGSDFFPSRIPTVSILDPGSVKKNLIILTSKKQKKGFYAIKNMIRVVLPIPDPGSRGQKGTGSRIRNTGNRIPSWLKNAKKQGKSFKNGYYAHLRATMVGNS